MIGKLNDDKIPKNKPQQQKLTPKTKSLKALLSEDKNICKFTHIKKQTLSATSPKSYKVKVISKKSLIVFRIDNKKSCIVIV